MKPIRLRVCRIAAGLLLYASGVYCCIQADIGLAPWDALHMGLSLHLPVSYGTASVLVALQGAVMQMIFRMVRFDPRTVRHQSIHDILPRSDSKYRRFARA